MALFRSAAAALQAGAPSVHFQTGLSLSLSPPVVSVTTKSTYSKPRGVYNDGEGKGSETETQQSVL